MDHFYHFLHPQGHPHHLATGVQNRGAGEPGKVALKTAGSPRLGPGQDRFPPDRPAPGDPRGPELKGLATEEPALGYSLLDSHTGWVCYVEVRRSSMRAFEAGGDRKRVALV